MYLLAGAVGFSPALMGVALTPAALVWMAPPSRGLLVRFARSRVEWLSVLADNP